MGKNERTSVKRSIVDAFMELMTQKVYMDITVTDIVNQAKVARVSFYRNFSSTNDIIDYIIEELSAEFIEDIFPILIGNNERKWREFLFEYFYRLVKNQKKIKAISLQNVSILFSRMNDKLQSRVMELPQNSLKDKYTAFGKLGLINNIAIKWMTSGMEESPEEIINYIMSFITLF